MYVETLKKISRSLIDAPCTALIAGGAVRDIDNGKPFKDIDIFCLTTEPDHTNQMIDFAIEDLGMVYQREHEAGDYGEEFRAHNEIDSVHDLTLEVRNVNGWNGNVDVQLIFQKNNVLENAAKQITKRFDLNICQITLDYDEFEDRHIITKSEGYKRDKQNGVITLTEHGEAVTGERRAKTRERARRISNKLNFRTDLSWDRPVGRGIVEEYANLQPQMMRYLQWGQQLNNPGDRMNFEWRVMNNRAG